MSISSLEIKKIGKLSRIALNDGGSIQGQLTRIFDWISELQAAYVSVAKNINLFAMFMVLACLTGCSQHNMPYDDAEFAKGNKAIVVMKTKASYTFESFLLGKKTRNVALGLKWQDSAQSSFALNSNSSLSESDYQVMQINPGNYTLKEYDYRGTNGQYSFQRTYTSHLNPLSFSVNKGDVVYIGDIYVDDTVSKGVLFVKDTFSTMQNYLREKYPKLAPNVRSINVMQGTQANSDFAHFMRKAIKDYHQQKKKSA